MSLRLAVARQAGLDEATAGKVGRHDIGDLREEHEAALRLADALMTMPGDISEALYQQLHRHFRPEQLLELTVDVMKWNFQKVSVALGTDAEVQPGALTDLHFDAEGNVQV
jgi:alkylhydroperoxidase family enzyme